MWPCNVPHTKSDNVLSFLDGGSLINMQLTKWGNSWVIEHQSSNQSGLRDQGKGKIHLVNAKKWCCHWVVLTINTHLILNMCAMRPFRVVYLWCKYHYSWDRQGISLRSVSILTKHGSSKFQIPVGILLNSIFQQKLLLIGLESCSSVIFLTLVTTV